MFVRHCECNFMPMLSPSFNRKKKKKIVSTNVANDLTKTRELCTTDLLDSCAAISTAVGVAVSPPQTME